MNFIRLHPADDIVIARGQLMSGGSVEGVPIKGLIPPGHKIATRALAVGDPPRQRPPPTAHPKRLLPFCSF
jgi:altronate hydrolase